MSGAQHTPKPWSVGGKYAFKSVLLNARGESIASGGNNRSVQGAELEASLEYAAMCVNTHDELLEALRGAADALDSYPMDDEFSARWAPVIERARAAIAKATGSAS